MEPEDFFIKTEGFFDKMENEAKMHRFAAYRIHQSLVEKPLSIEDFWPMWSDKKQAKENTAQVIKMWGDTPEERRANFEKVMKAGNPNWQPKNKAQ